MKIAIISCYDQIDYIRARTLRTAFAAVPGVETLIIKNKHKGLLRYLEVPCKLLVARFRHRPDTYVITFRGYEVLPFTLLVKGRRPLIFDEYINAAEYLYEHGRLKSGSRTDKLFRSLYSWLLKRCRFVLADTEAHARLSSELTGLPISQYKTVAISTDESVFFPTRSKPKKQFTVFYYGVMKKLHGLEHVLKAAVELAGHPDIKFEIGGDKGENQAAVDSAISQGANINYRSWYPFEQIPKIGSSAGLNLGGPFGNTTQSQYIITTKTFQFLALGAPVLIGRNKVNEGFKDRVNCLVVPQADADAIKSAILWAKQHPKELSKIASAGRQLYESHFSQQIINEKIAKLVKDL
jgi:glycosyltransferase involved in cell wall biosynthesis